MQTLELECPACSELLELDMGFAGGVCRCSACGTLMTVPQDAAQGAHAEQLTRPDRPDDPSGLSGVGDTQETEPRPRERASRPRRQKGKRGKPDRRGRPPTTKTGRRGKASAQAGEAIEQGVYTTASGRQVKIDRGTNVPTARSRRTGVRIATAVVFFSIIGAITLVGAVAIFWMVQNPKGGGSETVDPDAPVVEIDPTQFVYNKSENPYLLEQPNALGLPLTGTVAIVLETGPSHAQWNETIAEMIGTGLSRPGSEAKVLVFASGPDGLRVLRDQPTATTVVTPDLLTAFVKESGGTGTGGISDALAEALGSKPDTLILVTGQPGRDDIVDWEHVLEGHPGIVLHGVLIDGYAQAYEDWVHDHSDGYYISLLTDDLLAWRDEWQAGDE